ncbi:MAG: glycosyltransferase family 2 protein [Lachnospiraceae bacterium]|nr:glycosyltransferase family 2 protein [Lachnospiraceae bacterium]
MVLPKIGIVVPVYKVKKDFLDICVNSLLKQTYQNVQIILVDDCSPDNCGAVCDEYAKKDKRVKAVHHKKNLGLPSARNTGINHLDVDCTWVTFVDSDDWLDLNCCEKFVSYLNKWNENPDMVIFSGCKNYPDREVISEPAFDNETWFRGVEDINKLQKTSMEFIKNNLPDNSINLDSACWRFVSVKFLDKNNIRFINVPYREDGLFFLYTTEYAERIVYIYEPFYHYRSTENSMVNMYRPNADYEHKLYLQQVWKFINHFHKEQDFTDSVYYTVLLSMEICITQKFFNANNPDSFLKKQKECGNYFKEFPYRNIFKKIDIKQLRRNHYIKAIAIKYHLYYGLVILRNVYNILNRKQNYT